MICCQRWFHITACSKFYLRRIPIICQIFLDTQVSLAPTHVIPSVRVIVQSVFLWLVCLLNFASLFLFAWGVRMRGVGGYPILHLPSCLFVCLFDCLLVSLLFLVCLGGVWEWGVLVGIWFYICPPGGNLVRPKLLVILFPPFTIRISPFSRCLRMKSFGFFNSQSDQNLIHAAPPNVWFVSTKSGH